MSTQHTTGHAIRASLAAIGATIFVIGAASASAQSPDLVISDVSELILMDSTGDPSVWEHELIFDYDFNGDGIIGPPPVDDDGAML